jgi:hypothetical protein
MQPDRPTASSPLVKKDFLYAIRPETSARLIRATRSRSGSEVEITGAACSTVQKSKGTYSPATAATCPPEGSPLPNERSLAYAQRPDPTRRRSVSAQAPFRCQASDAKSAEAILAKIDRLPAPTVCLSQWH